MIEDSTRVLFDFTRSNSIDDWHCINDGVMGGRSLGQCRLSDHQTLEFHGVLSLDNNGGFASVRSKPKLLGIESGDVLIAKLRGDGRVYSINLYINKPLIAFSYRKSVKTEPDQWQEFAIPLAEFEATSFGRVVPDADTVEPASVHAIGFMLSDKRSGPFQLEVEKILINNRSKQT